MRSAAHEKILRISYSSGGPLACLAGPGLRLIPAWAGFVGIGVVPVLGKEWLARTRERSASAM